MQSTLRLFKALPVENKHRAGPDVSSQTLPHGFVIAPTVMADAPRTVVEDVISLYGRGSQELNQAFHTSFAKVRDASMRQLVLEQVAHYITTYGAPHLFDQRHLYVPLEVLHLPDVEKIRILVIRGLTKSELKAELLGLLGTGAALSEQTVQDALDVARFVGFADADIAKVKNREVRAALYDHLGIVPANPEEFVRFLVFKATTKTQVVKSRGLFAELRERDNADLVKHFATYQRQQKTLAPLGQVFNRYKPVFLGIRGNAAINGYVNEIARQSKTEHRPLQPDLLNTLTAKIKHGEEITFAEFEDALSAASVFRKARLAYALKFRTSDADSVVYRIRNGKSFVTDFSFPEKRKNVAQLAFGMTIDSIIAGLESRVDGKKVYITDGLHYGLPATEKQFTGNMPTGTYVELADDMFAGVHWNNVDGPRGGIGSISVDLDLSMTDANGKYGWDGAYRGSDLQYSGDLTNAPGPHGAAEYFRVGRNARGAWLMNVNHYNRSYGGEIDVPFKIIVGRSDDITDRYLVDPKTIRAYATSVMDVQQKTLGILVADKTRRFYFAEAAMGSGGSSARAGGHAEKARKFLLDYYTGAIDLNDLLWRAGAIQVATPEEADIDLSHEAVDKTTILTLLEGTEA